MGGTEGKGRTFQEVEKRQRQRYRDLKRTCVLKITEKFKVGEAGCELGR